MLSPYKLYKADKAVARKAVTHGPKGKPAAGSSGSKCYNNCGVDWTVHRLAPHLLDRTKPGGPTHKAIAKATIAYTGGAKELSGRDYEYINKNTRKHLQETSPRWGAGIAPGRKERKVVPLQKKGTVEVSKGTKVAAGTTVAAGVAGHRSTHQGRDSK